MKQYLPTFFSLALIIAFLTGCGGKDMSTIEVNKQPMPEDKKGNLEYIGPASATSEIVCKRWLIIGPVVMGGGDKGKIVDESSGGGTLAHLGFGSSGDSNNSGIVPLVLETIPGSGSTSSGCNRQTAIAQAKFDALESVPNANAVMETRTETSYSKKGFFPTIVKWNVKFEGEAFEVNFQ